MLTFILRPAVVPLPPQLIEIMNLIEEYYILYWLLNLPNHCCIQVGWLCTSPTGTVAVGKKAAA